MALSLRTGFTVAHLAGLEPRLLATYIDVITKEDHRGT